MLDDCPVARLPDLVVARLGEEIIVIITCKAYHRCPYPHKRPFWEISMSPIMLGMYYKEHSAP